MFKIFSPNILVAAVLALLAGLADLASAQGIYQDFSVTSVNFAARVVLTDFFGGVEAGKATCDQTPNCIGVVDAGFIGFLLSYDPSGTSNLNGITSVSWKYDAAEGPSCSSTTDQFIDASGNCQCAPGQSQNTPFGCTGPTPSGSFNKRSKQVARARVQLPGRPIQPQY